MRILWNATSYSNETKLNSLAASRPRQFRMRETTIFLFSFNISNASTNTPKKICCESIVFIVTKNGFLFCLSLSQMKENITLRCLPLSEISQF